MVGRPQRDNREIVLRLRWETQAQHAWTPTGEKKLSEDRDSDLAISLLSPQAWGLQIIYKSVKLPVLKVGSMLLETPQGRARAKKWSRVPFTVPDFDYVQYAEGLAGLSLD